MYGDRRQSRDASSDRRRRGSPHPDRETRAVITMPAAITIDATITMDAAIADAALGDAYRAVGATDALGDHPASDVFGKARRCKALNWQWSGAGWRGGDEAEAKSQNARKDERFHRVVLSSKIHGRWMASRQSAVALPIASTFTSLLLPSAMATVISYFTASLSRSTSASTALPLANASAAVTAALS